MGFSLEFSELKNQYESITKATNRFHNFLKDFLIEMAERVIAKTKPRTPKDTGALRRSWTLGTFRGVGTNVEVDILNGMEYATEIEYGHRKVYGGVEVGWYEGRFMLKISIDEIRKQMPLRWKKEFEQFCKEQGLRI